MDTLAASDIRGCGTEPGGIRPADDALDALADALSTLDRLLGIAVNTHAQLLGPATLLDPWRGMHLDRGEVERLLSTPQDASSAAESIGALLADAARCVPALARTAASHALSSDDLAVLLITIAPDLDLKYEKIYGYLQDDLTRRRATPDLVANLLATDARQRLNVLARLSADAPLVRAGLVSFRGDADASPRLACPLAPDVTWLNRLLGRATLDPSCAHWARLIDACELVDTATYGAELRAALQRANHDREGVHLLLSGAHGTGKFAFAREMAAASHRGLLVVDAREWMTPAEVRARLLHADRMAQWLDALVYVHGAGRLSQRDPQLIRAVLESLGAASVRFLISSATPIAPAAGTVLPVERVELSLPPVPARQAIWRHALARYGRHMEEPSLLRIASRFTMGPMQIEQAARDAVDATAAASPDAPLSYAELAAAARAQCGAQLAGLAQRITPEAGIDSLIVPPDVRAQLGEICARVTSRESVRHNWGAGNVHSRVIGVTALFAGPSGTGKTLAAEAIARELGFDLYRIELASVVSKYIGETERNLERVFAAAEHANAVLFFDEADALFGKRSEVKDAHDRYANIEIAYLLQKMERFDGLAVLATNLKQNLDEAFARRLTFTVNFPFPEQAQRRQLWEALWPPRAPRAADVDLDWFAREFRLSGGAIRNIVIAAAHLAADEGQAISRTTLLHATRREFQKVGKNLGEFALGTAKAA